MNYADMVLGTWYPEGGMNKIVEGMVKLAEEKGVKFQYNSSVTALNLNATKIKSLSVNGEELAQDFVVAGADYHHVEQRLLPAAFRRYSESYWTARSLAPSSLIYYVGVDKPLENLRHHNLFFDQDFEKHTNEIYQDPTWPTNPLFYVCCPSKSDKSVAPPGHENLFILIPVAAGLNDDDEAREKYFELVMNRMEKITHQPIRENIVYKKSYAHRDFIDDYNSYKGNAYGLANTIRQTANLKPSIINKKVTNLFYTGQLTVPGPGVPPSIISGQVAADLLIKNYKAKPIEQLRS
jgi:phytoene desaturase